jgi:hypothetical protein
MDLVWLSSAPKPVDKAMMSGLVLEVTASVPGSSFAGSSLRRQGSRSVESRCYGPSRAGCASTRPFKKNGGTESTCLPGGDLSDTVCGTKLPGWRCPCIDGVIAFGTNVRPFRLNDHQVFDFSDCGVDIYRNLTTFGTSQPLLNCIYNVRCNVAPRQGDGRLSISLFL